MFASNSDIFSFSAISETFVLSVLYLFDDTSASSERINAFTPCFRGDKQQSKQLGFFAKVSLTAKASISVRLSISKAIKKALCFFIFSSFRWLNVPYAVMKGSFNFASFFASGSVAFVTASVNLLRSSE